MTLGAICRRCPKVQPPPYTGRCDCLYDPAQPVPIHVRIGQHFCPLGKFPASDDEIVVMFEEDSRRGPCCAPPEKP